MSILIPDAPQTLLATVAIRATVILSAAWLLTWALRRSAASTRHVVWSVALASLLVLPVITAVAPRWSPRARDAETAIPAPYAAPAGMPATAAAPVPAGDHDHANLTAGYPVGRSPVSVPAILLAAWALGAAFGLGRLSAGVAAARRLVRRAASAPDGREAEAVFELSQAMGIGRDVSVLVSPTLTVPVNCGLWRPVILLPRAAAEWSAERLRVVLLHELAHVRRWDYASLLLTEAARALYWFNPLVWVAAHRANIELERACDDEVLRAGTQSVEYAEHLYQIAVALAGRTAPAGALAMAQPSTLRTRVGAILAARINRSPLRPRALAGATLLALVAGIPLASLQLLGEGREEAERRSAIRALSLGDPADRARAAVELGRRGASQAVVPLSARLHDPDASVRGMAAWALGAIGDDAAVPALVGALDDPDRSVREGAVFALGALGDPSAVPHLARLARDPEMGVRGVLTGALHHIGGAEAGAVLARMARTDSDAHVRDMSMWALRNTLQRDAVPTLIQALDDSAASVRGTAARNLYEQPDPRAFDALARTATTDREPQVRAAASYALGALEDPRAAEPLLAVLRDSDWPVRVAAAGALSRTPGPRAADGLIAATRDPVHQVRLTAMDALTERRH